MADVLMSPLGAGSALMVHGAGGNAWEWSIWARVWRAAGLACETVSLRSAAAGLAATGFADYRQQVADYADALTRPRVLLGASLGGLLTLAVAESVAVDALILVNPVPCAPWHANMPAGDAWPTQIPWRLRSSLSGTRAALPDGDDAAALYAFRRWRDESGAVMREACAGIALVRPDCPVLMLTSTDDQDVSPALMTAMAEGIGAAHIMLPDASHVGPLLGREAASSASRALAWLGAQPRFSGISSLPA